MKDEEKKASDQTTGEKSGEALSDEALDQVAGGVTYGEAITWSSYAQAFQGRNHCLSCNNLFKDNCPKKLDLEGLYKMFDGNRSATCPYKT